MRFACKARMKQILQRKIIKTGSMAQVTLSCRYAAIHLVYHGFYTISPFHVGRGALTLPPHGNFWTSVFCE